MTSVAMIPNLPKAHERCGSCPIRNRAVCSYCGPAELNELDQTKFYREYAPGQEIVGEGEVTRTLGSVVSGVVALHKTMEDGRRQIVGLLFASDFIGRPLRPVAPHEAVAVTDVRMCLFRRSQFEEILSHNPNLGRRLLEMTLDELDAARDWMLLLGRKSAREKVASFLMILARRAHSQMIRPMRDEVERCGHYNLAAESMYDHPFQWGSKRTEPDLARVGGRYSDEWHVDHVEDPRALVPESIIHSLGGGE